MSEKLVYEIGSENAERFSARLEMAFKVGDQKQLKLKALDDHDLEQLWAEIGEI